MTRKSSTASSWSGIWPAALSMFRPDGAFDSEATATHLDWLVAEGADGLVVGGTSGEFIGMSQEERQLLIAVATEAVDGRVPLVVGTGHFSTTLSVEMTSFAQLQGVDGALVVLPYFQRPQRHEVLDHYREVARVGLPQMIYNIPLNAATSAVTTSDLEVLRAEGCAHAVKSTLPTPHQVFEMRQRMPEDFRVFYGGVTAPLEASAGGAHGWISGFLNVAVADARTLWSAVQSADLLAARSDLQENTLGLQCFGFALRYSNPPMDAISCSVPVARLTPSRCDEIIAVMSDVRDQIERFAPPPLSGGRDELLASFPIVPPQQNELQTAR